jgi:hypothetical protein
LAKTLLSSEEGIPMGHVGISERHSSVALGRTGRKRAHRSFAGLLAATLATAAIASGFAVVGFATAASAATGSPVILFATPKGSGVSGCTSATTSPCSLAGAITAAGGSTYSTDAVTIELEHTNGSPCSASDICTFFGTQSVMRGSEASLNIEGTGTGSDSSAYSVLNGNSGGSTFTDSVTFPVTLDNVEVTGGSNGGNGGGIYNLGGSTMTVTDSTISVRDGVKYKVAAQKERI